MRGISTHGTYLLKVIHMRVKSGQLKLPTLPEIVMNSGATAVVDGKDGIGMVAGFTAAKLAVDKAKEAGVAIVLIRNTNNVGSLAFYTEYAASQGMAMIMSGNAAPAMAPWGGAEPFMGTNPLALSFPTGSNSYGFTVDMATSVVARGKIRKAARQGGDIPGNWALDNEGMATTDPDQALTGTLLPIGGPKGSALAMAIDIISGILSGSGYGLLIKSFHVLEGPTKVGASCIAIDISRFMEQEKFMELMHEYSNSVKNLKKAKGFDEILLPGEMERYKEQISLKNGIDMDPQQVKELNDILVQTGSDIRI